MQIIHSNGMIKWAVARAAVAVAGMFAGMSLVYASALQVSPVRLQFEGALAVRGCAACSGQSGAQSGQR